MVIPMKFRLIVMILCTIWLSEVWTVRIEIQEFVLVHYFSASPPNTFWCICNLCPDFFILFVFDLFNFYMQLFEFLLTIVGSAKLITVCCKDCLIPYLLVASLLPTVLLLYQNLLLPFYCRSLWIMSKSWRTTPSVFSK